jgi:formylglycine-generating enzyme required for sulfatase activity
MPKDQWCYLPNESGAYSEGMTIPADVLQRTGYRLPTEPEWEYACRSGTLTSYYFGPSIELLGKYARYQDNSMEHTWSCGSLRPNDLGLFDMLGNEFEWVQDRTGREMQVKRKLLADAIVFAESLNEKHPRFLRGGAYGVPLSLVRSAYRYWISPGNRGTGYGFRPARTYP